MDNRPFLRGDSIHLRALNEEDVRGPYLDWFNDAEVCRGNSHHVFPLTEAEALAFVRQTNQTRENLVLAIVRSADNLHIGNIALQRIHQVYRSAELAIVIGEKSGRGKGYSKEAARLLCSHGFFSLNLHRIGCGTFAKNIPMIRLAAYLGMQVEGRRREAAFKNDAYLDVVEFGVLRDEYAVRFGTV